MNIVYVVTSAGEDVYSAMTRLSAATWRRTNPGGRVVVVCDAETDRAVRVAGDPLIEEVDEWRAFETPPGTASFRNRYLKTSLRGRVEGPYLFLDSDTVIRGDLGEIFRVPGDIAAAANHSRTAYSHQISPLDRRAVGQLEWRIPAEVYVNGGVLRVADTAGARRFYQLWHAKWMQSHARRGDYRDQPSLNSALEEAGIAREMLPGRFNAQITHAPESAGDAVIWHYYAAQGGSGFNQIDRAVRRVQATGRVDARLVEELIENPVRWRRSFWETGAGRLAIRWASQDLAGAFQAGAEEGCRRVDTLRKADRTYARRALAKALNDAYWGGCPDVSRRMLRAMVRSFPGGVMRSPVRQCLWHGLRQRMKGK